MFERWFALALAVSGGWFALVLAMSGGRVALVLDFGGSSLDLAAEGSFGRVLALLCGSPKGVM